MDQTVLFIVALAGFGIGVLGTLMIVSSAFNKGLLWGVLGLIPVLNISYVVMNWKEASARNGILISIVGFLLLGVALYGGAEENLNQTLETAGVEAPIRMPVKAPGNTEVPNQKQIEEAGIDTSVSVLDEPEFIDPKELARVPPPESVRLPTSNIKRAFQPICPGNLSPHAGEGLRIVTKSGKQVEGFLERATRNSLFLRQYVHGGTVNFEYPYSDLKRIEVFDEVRGALRRSVNCAEERVEPVVSEPQAAPPTDGAAPEQPAPATPVDAPSASASTAPTTPPSP